MTSHTPRAQRSREAYSSGCTTATQYDLQHGKLAELAVPSFDCMQIRVADSQSRTPGWVSVNAFAHVQLRVGPRARVPVVCPLVDTFGAAREE